MCREGRWVAGWLEGRVREDNEYGGWEVGTHIIQLLVEINCIATNILKWRLEITKISH